MVGSPRIRDWLELVTGESRLSLNFLLHTTKTPGKKRPAERRAEERVAMMPLFVRAIQMPGISREIRNELNGEAE